ncbi:MAG: hypothetical protein HYV28_05705 [Ignavibacteriales bacterium]|nr:hypothetical protein [Ignavibacteriales bacterium]
MKNIFFFLLFLSTTLILAQDEMPKANLPEGLGISNQLKYSNDINTDREIFENWLNLDYTYGIFTTGIRFDIFQPVNFSTNWSGAKERYSDIGFKYIKAELGEADAGMELTVGNYYALFGRGMVLKSYEDRNLREDNNLQGVKIKARYHNLTVTALSGMPENKSGDRTDILHAADFEYRIMKDLKTGFSLASNQKQGQIKSTTTLYAFRVQPSLPFGDVYVEYGIKKDEDEKQENFAGKESITGKAFYGNLNMYEEGFSLSSEYKYYDNFSFTTGNGSVSYNTPPATRKDYTYLLLNRHTVSLDAANENGYLIEGSYQYAEGSSLLISYGLTNTLPAWSLYQRSVRKDAPAPAGLKTFTQMREVYSQIAHHFNDNLTITGIFGYNEESKDSTKNITPIIDCKYYLDEINTFRLIIEHQYTTERKTGETFYTDAVLIEYLRSPSFSVSLLSELETKEPTKGNMVRKMWNMVQFGYQIGEHTDLNLLFGSRQAGTICIGGVCRYEPEFSGVELKMMTRF